MTGSQLTVSVSTSVAAPADRTLYIVAKDVAGNVKAQGAVSNGAATLTWNAGGVENDDAIYTLTTGYDELALTPLATTERMQMSAVSSDFNGKGIAYISLYGLNYDKPMTLGGLQKYLTTEAGTDVVIKSAKHKDTTLADIGLDDQIFTPDNDTSDQKDTHIGTIYATVNGKDVTIRVNDMYAGYRVTVGGKLLGLLKPGMTLTITNKKVSYTDPDTNKDLSVDLAGDWFTVKSGKNNNGKDVYLREADNDGRLNDPLVVIPRGSGLNTISDDDVVGLTLGKENSAYGVTPNTRDPRYIENPDKEKTYTITVGYSAVEIMDDYWVCDTQGVVGNGSNAPAEAVFYARHDSTVDLSKLTKAPKGGVLVQKTKDGVVQENGKVDVTGVSPNVSFTMPASDVQVEDMQSSWNVTLGGVSKTTDAAGKLMTSDHHQGSGRPDQILHGQRSQPCRFWF